MMHDPSTYLAAAIIVALCLWVHCKCPRKLPKSARWQRVARETQERRRRLRLR